MVISYSNVGVCVFTQWDNVGKAHPLASCSCQNLLPETFELVGSLSICARKVVDYWSCQRPFSQQQVVRTCHVLRKLSTHRGQMQLAVCKPTWFPISGNVRWCSLAPSQAVGLGEARAEEQDRAYPRRRRLASSLSYSKTAFVELAEGLRVVRAIFAVC